MKKVNRRFEIARERRAARRAVRKHAQSGCAATDQALDRSAPRFARALSPLRATIMAALGLSGVTGCKVDTAMTQDQAGVEGGALVAGDDVAGTSAGEVAGSTSAGDTSGTEVSGVEVMAGITGGDDVAGDEVAGTSAGEVAGTSAGEVAGTSAGEIAGMTPPSTEFCESPVAQQNVDGELNGYTICERGIITKTGPANCLGANGGGECDTDSDCQEDQQCLCANRVMNIESRCVPASCSEGSDCDTGGCGLSIFEDGCGMEESLACYTDNDLCRSAEDCVDFSGLGCYANSQGWQCSEFLCAVGRPLTEEGDCQVAPLSAEAGWVETIPELTCAHLSESDQERVISYWAEVCQLEHSSVASFARFTMEMMAIGAPADLLLAVQEAAADEVRHARRAAELLSALGGERVGFGSLPIEQVQISAHRAEILERLIREACFGETLGVAEVTEQACLCDHPIIRDHLATVRDDETRHAGLAWRALQWIIESADTHERPALVLLAQNTFASLGAEFNLARKSDHAQGVHAYALNHFGVLTAAQTHRARSAAYYEVIVPCIQQLDLTQVTSA